jgi:ABC-type multidrug transport system permease subunit
MLRATWIVFQNEFRLLAKDRSSLFMLALAPLMIITVAGFSLGNIYGVQPGSEPYYIVVVDNDHGWLAHALIDALASDHSVAVERVGNLDEARTIVGTRARAPLCIVIPPATTSALEAGHNVHLPVYIDPVKRLEAWSIEFDLDRLCREITAHVHDVARRKITDQADRLRAQLLQAADQMKNLTIQLDQLRPQFERARATAQAQIIARTRQAINQTKAAITSQVDQSIAQTRTAVEQDLASRRAALLAVSGYLVQLQASQHDFTAWLAALKAAAGSHASQIPPPPRWPAPLSETQLAELSKPFDFPTPHIDVASLIATPNVVLSLPQLPKFYELPSIPDFGGLLSTPPAVLPGILGWLERSIAGGDAKVNAFDQYVPGFGITFLLIDMAWGVGVGLIDERDWGTLARLHINGAPAAGMMLGKLVARFLMGLGQMILLFGAGWLLFGISLGPNSWALLFPAAAISFAAASLSLVIACIANSRDAVLPIGAMSALVMSAAGGCWWPLDFEPYWMRAAALAMPTTWTMTAFNNLMIRGFGPASIEVPTLATCAIGLGFLAIGILSSSRIYRHAGQ